MPPSLSPRSLSLVLFLFAAVGVASPPWALPLGTTLFGDGDGFVSDPAVGVRVGQPRKQGHAVLTAEHPWEVELHFYGAVVTLDDGTIRMYYSCKPAGEAASDTPDDACFACVANSADYGLTWTKPLLPLFPFVDANGTRYSTTNIVFQTPAGWMDSVYALPQGAAVAGTPPGTAFLMAFDNNNTPGVPFRTLQLASSVDGYNFTVLLPLSLPENFADTSVSVFVQPSGSLFAYGRRDGAPDAHPGQVCGDAVPNYNMKSVRGVQLATTPPGKPTSLNFSAPHDVFAFDAADPQCVDVYNTAAVAYPAGQEGGAVLIFPAFYQHFGDSVNDGVLNVRFAWSRNGTTGFAYPGGDRTAWLPRGLGSYNPSTGIYSGSDASGVPAAWDAGLVYMYRGVVDNMDGTLSMFYFGAQATHRFNDIMAESGGQYGVGRVTIRKDGWMALGSGVPMVNATTGDPAWYSIVSRPVTLPVPGPGCSLHLAVNVDASVGGNVTLAIRDAGSGAEIGPFSHSNSTGFGGNHLGRVAAWGTVANLTDVAVSKRVVLLDFRLRAPAWLYGFSLACGQKRGG